MRRSCGQVSSRVRLVVKEHVTGSGGGCCWECVADSGECITGVEECVAGSGGVRYREWGSV